MPSRSGGPAISSPPANVPRTAGKAVVLLHGGRGARARRAVQSHTGAMVTDFGAMHTLVTDAGVLMVESLDELIDVADLLVRYPVPPTAGPAIMTSSGAFAALTHDFCEGLGLEIPQVSENTKAALRQALPDFQVAANPVDILANNTEGITTAARALIEDPKMGSLFVFLPMDGKLGVPAMQSVLKGIEGTDKPVIAAAWGDTSPLPPAIATAARTSRVAFIRSPDRCLRAIALVTAYGRTLGGLATPCPPDRSLRCLPWARAASRNGLESSSSPQPACRLPVGALARSADEALRYAERVGYPVALKAQAAALSTRLRRAASCSVLPMKPRCAVRGARSLKTSPARNLASCLTACWSKMAARGVELMVGGRRDPAWGPVLLLGLGGIWVEAMGDTRAAAARCGARNDRRRAAALALC